jgi:preprotein translocase subunit SecB
MENIESSFHLKGIFLTNLSFERIPEVIFDEEGKPETEIKVDNRYNDANKQLMSKVTVNVRSIRAQTKQYLIEVSIVGIFEFSEQLDIKLKDFASINAPAIVFPFIREQIVSISLKAGLRPILIPVVNFAKIAKNSNSDIQPQE